MMDPREQVQWEARRWIGTPYKHQHRFRGAGGGIDCVNLVWAVGEACNVLEIDPVAAKPFLGYGRLPNATRLLAALNRFWRPIEPEDALPGDIPVMGWDKARKIPQHMGILAEIADGRRTLIHADGQTGKCVEVGFSGEWPERVLCWFRFPGLS